MRVPISSIGKSTCSLRLVRRFVVVLRPSHSVVHRDISDAGCPKKEEKLLFAFQEVEKVISLLNAKRAEGLFSLSICKTGPQLKEASHANNTALFWGLEVSLVLRTIVLLRFSRMLRAPISTSST